MSEKGEGGIFLQGNMKLLNKLEKGSVLKQNLIFLNNASVFLLCLLMPEIVNKSFSFIGFLCSFEACPGTNSCRQGWL